MTGAERAGLFLVVGLAARARVASLSDAETPQKIRILELSIWVKPTLDIA